MNRKDIFQNVKGRITAKRQFIQALFGPRQVGKTTLALKLCEDLEMPSHYVSADSVSLEDHIWLEQQWYIARKLIKDQNPVLLVIDEIQKIVNWSSIVKKLWDEDTKNHTPLQVVILGSSPWLMQKGLTESLAGRFELIPVTHWSFSEMEQTFAFNLDQFIYFGGYPGAAPLIGDEKRWKDYIGNSLIETTVSRDILLMSQINKPVLLRRLFQLGCTYSGQILSYQKMIGQLQDVGNTTTLAHYLELLAGAQLLTGIEKFSKHMVRQRASSPKLQVFNTALMSAEVGKSFLEAKNDAEYWGRLVESAVGAHLLNSVIGNNIELKYWRYNNYEVDFVLSWQDKIIAIEVKSGWQKHSLSGMKKFNDFFKPYKSLVVGRGGIDLKIFFKTPVIEWFS